MIQTIIFASEIIILVSHKNVEVFYLQPFKSPDNPVPEHEEVESNEESQHSSYIRHQGEGGVGLNLLQNLDLLADKRRSQACIIFPPRIWRTCWVPCQLNVWLLCLCKKPTMLVKIQENMGEKCNFR